MNPTVLFLAAKAVIVNKNNEVLLVRESARYEDGQNVGFYDVPGGRLLEGEMLLEGLAREVKEEVGLRVIASSVLDAYDTVTEKNGVRIHIARVYYVVEADGEVVLSSDHDEYVWMPVKEAWVSPLVIPGMKRVFDAFLKTRKDN